MKKGYGGTATITITLRMTAPDQTDFRQAVWTLRDRIDRTLPTTGGIMSHSRNRKLAEVHSVQVDSEP